MDEYTCSICFFEMGSTDHIFKCAETRCKLITCQECIEALIEYAKNNNLLPSCPSNECNGIYVISSLLKRVSINTIRNYELACFNYFMKNDGDTVKKRLAEQEMIKKIRNDRLKFLESTFPKAISLVAKLTFNDKMRRLDKQKKEVVGKKLKNSNRLCINTTCGGFMDTNFVCLTCLTEFCKKCERTKENGHKCKQEDLDSINLVNDMVHCPGCQLPVFKNEGCDSITCAHCNTNFLYSTGKKGGHGSSNIEIKLDTNNKKKLSSEFRNSVSSECLQIILNIEAKEPKTISKDVLLTAIKYYIKTGKKIGASVQLARKLDMYTRNKYMCRDYQIIITKIEGLITGPKEDLQETLMKILEDL